MLEFRPQDAQYEPMALILRFTTMWSYRRLLARTRRNIPDWNSDGEQGLSLFIVSSGRSGSTLLRRMLHSNPAVSIPPESEDLIIRSLENWFTYRNSPNELLEGQRTLLQGLACMAHWKIDVDHVMAEWKGAMERGSGFPSTYASIYRSYAERTKPNATIHGDKTPLLVWYTDLLHELYPKSRIVHLVRNPLDAVSSLVTLDATKHDLQISMERWNNAATIALNAHNKPYLGRFISIQYEELVTQPEQVLANLCTMLEIPFDRAMVNDRSHDLGDTSLPHHASVARLVDGSSIGVWRDRLTKKQAMEILRKCGPTARAIGYQL